MRAQPAYAELEELRSEYLSRREKILERLEDFRRVSRSEYFYELAYCLLTPQSSAASAARAVERLKEADFFGTAVDAAGVLGRKDHYIRFHNTKAKHLVEAKKNFQEILEALGSVSPVHDLRAWLALNVKGLGWKEASHFLRNIGFRDVAILDRHILKNLRRHRVIRALPKTLTRRRYLSIEEKFRRFGRAIGIPMDELDLLFWSRETGEILK